MSKTSIHTSTHCLPRLPDVREQLVFYRNSVDVQNAVRARHIDAKDSSLADNFQSSKNPVRGHEFSRATRATRVKRVV